MSDIKKNKLNKEDVEKVSGGTFTANEYSEKEYNEHGISTSYHPFDPDEFWLPDGTKTDEEGANKYIKEHFPAFYNEHNKKEAKKIVNSYMWD